MKIDLENRQNLSEFFQFDVFFSGFKLEENRRHPKIIVKLLVNMRKKVYQGTNTKCFANFAPLKAIIIHFPINYLKKISRFSWLAPKRNKENLRFLK